MPIFEFKCKECENRFEKIVFKPLDQVEIKCPKCGSKEVEKLISALGSIGAGNGSGCSSGGSSRFT